MHLPNHETISTVQKEDEDVSDLESLPSLSPSPRRSTECQQSGDDDPSPPAIR